MVIEIGTATGGTVLAINQWLSKLKLPYTLYCIDPFVDGGEGHKKQWWELNQPYVQSGSCILQQDYADNITPPEEIHFVLVDANHFPEVVKSNARRFGPRIVKGGWMLFHDTSGDKVPSCLVELDLPSHGWRWIAEIARPGLNQEGLTAFVKETDDANVLGDGTSGSG